MLATDAPPAAALPSQVLLMGKKIYCACVGDSRAILGRKGADGKYSVVELSIDQKPDTPAEQARTPLA